MEQIYESFGTLDFDVFFSGPKKRWGWGWEVAWFIGKWHLWQKGASSSLPSCWQFIYHLCSRIYSHIYLYIIIHTYIYIRIIYTRSKHSFANFVRSFLCQPALNRNRKKTYGFRSWSETLVLLKMHQRLAYHEILWNLLLNSHCVPNVLTTRWFGIGVCGISFQLVLTFLWNRLPVFGPVCFGRKKRV